MTPHPLPEPLPITHGPGSDRFAFQPDGHATYTATVLDESAAREAEELCPVSAISLVFDEEEKP